jgi:glycosyltransferase involved in cell wall biosynthesis
MDRVAIFLYRLRFGGAERVMLTLAEEFIRRGLSVDVIAFDASGEFAANLPSSARLVDIGSLKISKAQDALKKYINDSAPEAILANGDRCTAAAFWAKYHARNKTAIVSVVHHDLLGILALSGESFKNRFLARVKQFPMSFIYRRIDAVAAVSEGTADSVHNFLGYPRDRISVIYNPVDADALREKADKPATHPWFTAGRTIPVIVSSGRLTAQKDFPTLLRAFRLLTDKTPARLAIIGDGPERTALENLIDELGLKGNAELLGFQENPFKYVARADLFALSSVFEGFGMVILEAMALGIPAVSTNCPSGPAELLRAHPERLVPTRDPQALANAMESGLKIGREENDMTEYSVQNCARKYLELIYGSARQ